MHNYRTVYRISNINSIVDLVTVWYPGLEMDCFIGGLSVALECERQIVVTTLTTFAGVTPIEADAGLVCIEFPVIVMHGESITGLVHAAREQTDRESTCE